MNLKELVRTQSDLVGNRRDESDSQCKQAYFLIGEAEAKGFVDKTPLKQAMRLFIQAARQRRSYVEPYIGLAYLSLLIDQKEVAHKYLQTALKLEPQNEDALRLLRYLSEEPEASAKDGIELLELPGKDLDQDQLYDQLEKTLFHWIRELMKLPPPQPVFKAEAFELLQRQTEELQDRLQGFERQIASLDKEFDTSELRRRMRPLEVVLQRSQRAIEVSEKMQMILKQIQGLIESVRSISARLESSRPDSLAGLENELESLIDSCDWVADHLDPLDEQGYDISVLLHHYRMLTEMIEQIRDRMDELQG